MIESPFVPQQSIDSTSLDGNFRLTSENNIYEIHSIHDVICDGGTIIVQFDHILGNVIPNNVGTDIYNGFINANIVTNDGICSIYFMRFSQKSVFIPAGTKMGEFSKIV